MVQTHPERTAEYTAGRPGRDWVRVALIGGAVAFLVLGVFLLKPVLFGSDKPAPTPPPPAAASVTTAAGPTAEQQAYTDTEKVMRAWLTNYAAAVTTFDAAKLNQALITPEVSAKVKADLDRLKAPAQSGHVTGKYTADVRKIAPVSYTTTHVTTSVCALRDGRFIQGGKDITVDKNKNPLPPATVPLWQTMEFSKVGATWKVSAFELDTTQGNAPC